MTWHFECKFYRQNWWLVKKFNAVERIIACSIWTSLFPGFSFSLFLPNGNLCFQKKFKTTATATLFKKLLSKTWKNILIVVKSMKKKYAMSLLSNLHTSIKTPIKWKIILFFLHKHALIQFKYHKIKLLDIRLTFYLR